MCSNTRLTNTLLLVIAGCLCLIVVRLYGVPAPVGMARAAQLAPNQPVQVSNVPLPVRMVGDPIRVQLVWQDRANGWLPLGVDRGALLVRQ